MCECPPDSKIKYSCVSYVSMYYTVCYFTGIFYAVVRQISMLFIDNKDFVFCTVVESYVVGEGCEGCSRKANFYVIHRQ